MSHTTLVLTVCAVGLGALCAWVAVRALGDRSGSHLVRALLAAGALGSGFALLVLVVLRPRGLDSWGALHLLYLLLTISVPIVGATLAIAGLRRPRSTAAIVVGALLVVPAPVGAYATHVEPYRLGTDIYDLALDDARSGDDTVRIAILADLQTSNIGSYEHEAVDRLMATDPDIIVIPGDLFQGEHHEVEDQIEPLRELVSRLDAPGGVFAVEGDSDHWWRVRRELADLGVTTLDDEIAETTVGDRRISIVGIQIGWHEWSTQLLVRSLESAPEDGSIRIVLSHRPDTVNDLPPRSRIDLVIAGHTHGGQIAIPGFGPIVTMSDVPRSVARGGLHEVNGNAIVVSPGVGLERGQAPQVRLFAPPAITVVDLH